MVDEDNEFNEAVAAAPADSLEVVVRPLANTDGVVEVVAGANGLTAGFGGSAAGAGAGAKGFS